MKKERRDHEPPAAVAEMGWRYHHMGIPTTVARPGEVHLPHLGCTLRASTPAPSASSG